MLVFRVYSFVDVRTNWPSISILDRERLSKTILHEGDTIQCGRGRVLRVMVPVSRSHTYLSSYDIATGICTRVEDLQLLAPAPALFRKTTFSRLALE